jgi:hypothetical protein
MAFTLKTHHPKPQGTLYGDAYKTDDTYYLPCGWADTIHKEMCKKFPAGAKVTWLGMHRYLAFLFLHHFEICPTYVLLVALGCSRINDSILASGTISSSMVLIISKCLCQGRALGMEHMPRQDCTMVMHDAMAEIIQQHGRPNVCLVPFPAQPFCCQKPKPLNKVTKKEQKRCGLCQPTERTDDVVLPWVGLVTHWTKRVCEAHDKQCEEAIVYVKKLHKTLTKTDVKARATLRVPILTDQIVHVTQIQPLNTHIYTHTITQRCPWTSSVRQHVGAWSGSRSWWKKIPRLPQTRAGSMGE